jgi:hypothetical protein
MPTRTLYASDTFQRVAMLDDVQAIIDVLGRDQIDLARFKRAYRLRANLNTNEQQKYRNIAQAILKRTELIRTNF